jgi:vitamin B12 transporter
MKFHTKLSLSVCSAAVLAATAAEAQQPIPLPGIVIEGATLEKAPVAQKRTSKPSDEDDTPAPQAVTAPKPAAPSQAKSAAKNSPAPAAAQPNIAPAAPVPATDQLTAGMPATQIGSAVTVVTSKDIQQQQARTSGDVLRALPGVNVSNYGSPGTFTQVRIRGNDGRDTRVLIDGIEANTTKDHEYDFSNLSPDDIEKIEIIRGPMSALYGSGAIGGVINIETKGARGPLALSVRAEGGSFGTRDFAGRLAAGGDSGFISLTAQARDSAGFVVAPGGSIKQDTHLNTYGLRAGLTLSPTAKLDTTVRYTDKRAGLTGFGDDTTKPLQTADDSDFRLVERTVLAGVRLSWDQFGGALTQQLKANYNNDVSGNRIRPLIGFLAGTDSHSRDESGRTNFGYSATYRMPTSVTSGTHVFTAQLEKQSETFKPFADGDFFFGYGGDGIQHRRSQLAAAGEWRGTFAERLTLTAGGRRDVNDTFANFNTWRTAATYDWKELGLRPHASLGTGVKLPGMYDQFGANAVVYRSNPNLQPETSRGYDLGIETKFLGGSLVTDVTYFSSDLRNKISLTGDPVTFVLFPDNASGVTKRKGVEFSAQYQITPALFLSAAYTYTDARQPDGTAEYRRVPHGYRFDTRYLFDEGKGTISMSAVYNSRSKDVAFDPGFNPIAVDLQSYWLVQLAASYKIQPNVEIYGRIENALNSKYQEVYGYNTAGLGAYAGVKIKFDTLLGSGK